LAPEELFRITGGAVCLLYVSFYEGFGMPVLEAMSCNVPVIASDRSAIPEITGDAAIQVDPASVDSIANALFVIQNDEEKRQSLILMGQDNLKRFSWDESANLFWQSILKTLQ
jgi:glycosyltransferase involved in cell wall biosynthesis